MKRSLFNICLVAFVITVVIGSQPTLAHDHLSVEKTGSKFQIKVGDDLFAELDYSTYARPIIYPIYGPG